MHSTDSCSQGSFRASFAFGRDSTNLLPGEDILRSACASINLPSTFETHANMITKSDGIGSQQPGTTHENTELYYESDYTASRERKVECQNGEMTHQLQETDRLSKSPLVKKNINQIFQVS